VAGPSVERAQQSQQRKGVPQALGGRHGVCPTAIGPKKEGLVSYRRFALLALIASLPATASAQFTTFIPPQKAKDSVKAAVAAQQQARTDSVTTASVTNMRAWVDSAAGVLAPTSPDTAADPLKPTSSADPLKPTSTDSLTMRNGSPAPMTASALPLLLLLGMGSLSAGAILLVRPATRRYRA
jgi:hypothetical protein